MSPFHGAFVWYELMTTDAAAAEPFYKSVVGWGAKDAGMPDMSYTLFNVGEIPVAGLMTCPESVRQAGWRPGWIGHVAVDDVDASAAQAAKEGGVVHRAPQDIPGVGRFAIIADPQGVIFSLFKGNGEPPAAPAPGTPGHTGWRELHARDREPAFAFYSKLFGWTKAEAHDMGPMGVYQIFAHKGEPIGGMLTKSEAVPAPFWLYYFNVESIEAAMARVKAGDGQILSGPHEVPGGSWIVQCLDPQGAAFALVAPRR
ncbi:MAG TPA: VOC family protein [Beijerinckiaceae bacterium]|nr:VOC family protein [Beijerinckiaceae bacterium]